MAKEKKLVEAPLEETATPTKPKKAPVRRAWNISNQRLELEIEGTAVVIFPKQTIEIPADFVIPPNIGLVER